MRRRGGSRGINSALAAGATALLFGCAGEPLRVASDADFSRAVESLSFGGAAVAVSAGDIADCDDLAPAEATARLVNAVLDAHPDAWIFTTGDHAYEDGTELEFERCYEPTWGEFNERTAPTPGNHEYDSPGAAPYFAYFDYYSRDPAARERGYYSFEVGVWHVASLNSNLPMDGESAQLRWLEQDLENTDARCILAYWHHPLFTSGLHRLQRRDPGKQVATLWKALAARRADLIVNGHAHMYERFAPQDATGVADSAGITQFVVGTGGGELDAAVGRRPNSRYVNDRAHGVLVLALRASSYEWAFIGVDGVVHDRSTEPVACDSEAL